MSNKASKGCVHVLHVVPGLLAGGMELTMAKVIAGLGGEQFQHTIIALKAEPEILDRIPSETEVHCLHSRPNELRLPARLAEVIREAKPTVIHARNWGAWPDTTAANLLVRRRIPVILSFHGLGKADYMPMRRRLASWGLARMASALFTVSQQSKELMVSKWGWPRRKTEVIPNGVDTARFVPQPRAVGSRVVIGSVGNLRAVKNHALLVRACATLVDAGVNLELRIAGEGEEENPLLTIAQQTRFGDRLKLFGRVEDIPGFLNQLDLFVLSSDSEQHPNALNEAMACGLPCIATRVGCVDELLDGGRCGKIVAPGSRAEMVTSMRDLLHDPDTARRYGESARERACRHYSVENMLSRYNSLYRRVLQTA